MCNQFKKCLRFHPYSTGERPSRAKWQEFIVDGRYYAVLGVHDPSGSTCRPAGYPDDPDDQIIEALYSVVKGWY